MAEPKPNPLPLDTPRAGQVNVTPPGAGAGSMPAEHGTGDGAAPRDTQSPLASSARRDPRADPRRHRRSRFSTRSTSLAMRGPSQHGRCVCPGG